MRTPYCSYHFKNVTRIIQRKQYLLGFPRIKLGLPRKKLGFSKMLSVRCLNHFTMIKQNNDNLG